MQSAKEPEWIHLLFRGAKEDSIESNLQDDDYIAEFRSINHLSLAIPLLQFNYTNLLDLHQLLALQATDKSCIYGLILTSPRVVEAISRALDRFDHIETRERIVDSWNNHGVSQYIYAVGDKTSQIAEKVLGLRVENESTKTGSGSELAKFIIKTVSSIEYNNLVLIHPHSDRTDGSLSQSVKTQGIRINSLVVYNNEPIPKIEDYLKNTLYDFLSNQSAMAPVGVNLIFFSPSGVNSLYPHLGFLESELRHFFGDNLKILHSCIGPTTKKAMIDLGMKVFCASSKPNAKTLVNEIVSGILSS